MIGSRSTVGASPEETIAALRERAHTLGNELFALTLRADRASAEVTRRRADLARQLAHAREQLAHAEALVKRAREQIRAT